jgi:hypothetical protein
LTMLLVMYDLEPAIDPAIQVAIIALFKTDHSFLPLFLVLPT